ncbi:MAG: energy transducer TonB [Myxococcales bacterium]|nr:energy transducer TonB [Myxococcales bacterium]
MASSLALPPGGGAAAEDEPERVKPKPKAVKPKVVRDARQPNKAKTEVEPSSANTGEEGPGGPGPGGPGGPGEPGPGGPGGPGVIPMGDLCLDPDLCAPPPMPVALEVEKPTVVPETHLRQMRRTAGDPQIQPLSSTRNAMTRAGKDSAMAIMRMCLDNSGAVSKAQIVRSSGYAEYDAKLKSSVRRWRYEPFLANGRPAAICTQVTFIYQQE